MQITKKEHFNTKIKSAVKYVRENTPVFATVTVVLAIVAFFVRIVCRLSPAFADFFVRYIAGGVRFVMATVSNVVPFSIAEIIIIVSPLICAVLIYLAVKFSKNKRRAFRYAATIVGVIALIYFLFVFTYAMGYHTSPLANDFKLQVEETTPTELKNTAMWLSSEAGKYAETLEYADGKKTNMPFWYFDGISFITPALILSLSRQK